MSPTLFTIGHSNHKIEYFLSLLAQHEVRCLVDIRSKPFSRFNPQFNQKALKLALEEQGIAYVYLGKKLGGKPDDPSVSFKGPDGKLQIDYAQIAQRPWFLDGLSELVELAQAQPSAILCAEANPAQCHRHWLVGRSLAVHYPTLPVVHILKDGRLIKMEELPENPDSQLHFRLNS